MTTSPFWQLAAVRVAVGQCVVITGLFFCAALRLGQPVAMLAVVTLTVACATRLPAALAAFLGLAAWAYFTGFEVNRYGELTFATTDLIRLALFLTCATAAHWRR